MFKYSIRRIFILLIIIFIIVAIAECGRKKKKKGKKIAIGRDEPSSSSSSKIETKNEQNVNEKLEEDLLAVKKENIELKNEMEKIEKENIELKNEIAKMEEKSKYFGECPICMNPFKFDDISTHNCGHTYHHKCIKTWINMKEKCPKCRRKNTKGNIIPLFIDEPNKSTNDKKTILNDGIELAEYDWNAYKLNAAADRSTKLTISEEGIVATNSDGWNCIRSILPIPAFNLNGINKPLINFYFEMEILNKSDISSGGITIGFCDQKFPLQDKVLGMEYKSNSIGIWNKSDIWFDGNVTNFGMFEYFKQGDFVGIGIIHHPNSNMQCFAAWNGQLLEKAELPQKFAKIQLFPVVELSFTGDLIRVNFGKEEWKFKKFELLLE